MPLALRLSEGLGVNWAVDRGEQLGLELQNAFAAHKHTKFSAFVYTPVARDLFELPEEEE